MKSLYQKWLGLALAMALIVGVAATAGWAEEKQANDENEIKITLDQAPAAVKAAIEQESQGAKVEEIEKETQGGKTTYEVEIIKDSKKSEVKFAENGQLIGRESDADDENEKDEDVKLTLDQLPAAVRATIQHESQGAEIKIIEKEKEDGRTVYAADLLKGKEKSEIKVAEDGKFLEREVVISLKQVPSAVRATLQKEAQGGKIGKEIEKAMRDGKAVYSADITVGKKKSEVEVAADGTVLKREAEDQDDDE